MKEKYINPLTDFGFKKLFGTEPNKALLIDFLNELLPHRHQIQDLEYNNNEQLRPTKNERGAIFDIYCSSANGERFIVELQRSKQKHFKERSVYYSCFSIREQAKSNDWDFELEAVYTICILDFKFDAHKEEKELVHRVKLKDEQCRLFYDKLTYIYIELPKFEKAEEELTTRFEKWLYVFRYLAELQKRPAKLQERIFERLFAAAEIAKFTPMELSNYERSLKQYRDYHNTVDFALEQGIEQGERQGWEKGLKQGVEQGIKQGIEQGLEQGKLEAKLEIVKKLYANHTPVEQIMKIVDLSETEIKLFLKKIE